MTMAVAHACAHPQYSAGNTNEMVVKALLVRPQAISASKLWSFLKKINLSREVSKLSNFADGKVIHTYAPLLITFNELHRLQWECKADTSAKRVWNHLGLTAFKQLCIQISEETVSGFERAEKEVISGFFVILFQQLDQFNRMQMSFNSATRHAIAEQYHLLKNVRAFEGTSFKCQPTRPWAQGKTVIRLSNVDYQTAKADVQRFLFPIIVDACDIHIPVHLSSGKMTYTIYIVFDDPVLPLRAVDLHSGHTLLSRRVEIKVVPLDELLSVFFGRSMQHSTQENPEWVLEDSKERLLKLCKTVRNTFNGKTPERPFEHTLSFLQLLPWTQSFSLSAKETERAFQLIYGVSVALLTFLHTDTLKTKFTGDLLHNLVSAGLSMPFHEDQLKALHAVYLKYLAGPSTYAPMSTDWHGPVQTGYTSEFAPRRDPLRKDLLSRRMKPQSGLPSALSISVPTSNLSPVPGAPMTPMSAPPTITPPRAARTPSPTDSVNTPTFSSSAFGYPMPMSPASTRSDVERHDGHHLDVCPEHVLGKHLWDVL